MMRLASGFEAILRLLGNGPADVGRCLGWSGTWMGILCGEGRGEEGDGCECDAGEGVWGGKDEGCKIWDQGSEERGGE